MTRISGFCGDDMMTIVSEIKWVHGSIYICWGMIDSTKEM